MFRTIKKIFSIRHDIKLLQEGLVKVASELQKFQESINIQLKIISNLIEKSNPSDQEAMNTLMSKIQELNKSTLELESAVNLAETQKTVTITNK